MVAPAYEDVIYESQISGQQFHLHGVGRKHIDNSGIPCQQTQPSLQQATLIGCMKLKVHFHITNAAFIPRWPKTWRVSVNIRGYQIWVCKAANVRLSEDGRKPDTTRESGKSPVDVFQGPAG